MTTRAAVGRARGSGVPTRGSGGPWRLALVARWQPFPRALPRLVLSRTSRTGSTASFEAALVAARQALGGPARDERSSETVPRVLAEIRDGDGRLAWQGTSVEEVREAARRHAGWTREPPVAVGCQPPHPSVAGPSPAITTRSRTPTTPTRSSPTPAQRAVIAHEGRAAVVLAVAGAGKTTTMVARVATLIDRGVPPSTILVTSFSRAAVADLRNRLATEGADAVEVRTFHSLAYAIVSARIGGETLPTTTVRRHGLHGPPAPPPDEVVPRLVRAVVDDWRSRGRAGSDRADEIDLGAFSVYRGRCLARLALPAVDRWPVAKQLRRAVRPAPEDPEHEVHRMLAEAVEAERLERGWLDHDAAIVHAWLAASGDAALRDALHTRWKHLLVDEFQDVNPAQIALLEALLAPDAEVMAIGDDDQSIYAFRGSDPALLSDFARRHAAATYVLDDNFRGRPETLAAAARLVEHVRVRSPKRLRAARARGGCCTLDVERDPAPEALALAVRVMQARADRPDWTQAVLLRSFAQAPVIEEALLRSAIPYRLVGSPSVDRGEATRTALAALVLLARPQAPAASRARAWRRWLRGAASAPAHATRLVPALVAAEEALRSSASACAGEDLAGAALRSAVGREDGARWRALSAALERVREAAASGAVAALRAARDQIGRWPRTDRDAVRLETLLRCADTGVFGPGDAPMAAWLDTFTTWRGRSARRDDAVLITSAHRSKGLEWDVVHVPGQVLGIFPRQLDDDERRLAYVAWTRARERLHLYRPWPRAPAPLLDEGDVGALIALQSDLAWLATEPAGMRSLAGRWAHLDAERMLGGSATEPAR